MLYDVHDAFASKKRLVQEFWFGSRICFVVGDVPLLVRLLRLTLRQWIECRLFRSTTFWSLSSCHWPVLSRLLVSSALGMLHQRSMSTCLSMFTVFCVRLPVSIVAHVTYRHCHRTPWTNSSACGGGLPLKTCYKQQHLETESSLYERVLSFEYTLNSGQWFMGVRLAFC